MKPSNPIVGQWYVSRETDRVFEVVSVDDAGVVEMQDYDGNLDEVERDGWFALAAEAIDPPDDLMGVFDFDADADDERRFDDRTFGLRAVWQRDGERRVTNAV